MSHTIIRVGLWDLFPDTISHDVLDYTDLDAIFDSIDKFKKHPHKSKLILWMESPSNPMLKVVDIASIAHRARGDIVHARHSMFGSDPLSGL